MSTDYSKKEVFLKVFSIGFPIAMQNLVSVLINMLDTIMIGQVGEAELAAINQCNALYVLFTNFMWGIGIGTVVITSRYYGMGKTEPIKKLVGLSMRINIIASIVLSIITLLFPYNVMRFFAADADVIEYGVQYLKIMGLFYIIPAISYTYLVNLRAVHNVKISVVIYTGSCLSNLILNWILIYGNLGAPALGVRGAAIATVISKAIELVIVIFYMYRKEKVINFRLSYIFGDTKEYLHKFCITCIPVFFSEFIWAVGMTIQAAAMGQYNKEFLAAYSLVMVIMDLSTVAMCGFSNASMIILSNDIGAGKDELAIKKSRLFVISGMIVGVFMASILVVLRPYIPGLIVCSDITKQYILKAVYICIFVDLCYGISWNMGGGVLRAGGDTKYIAIIDASVTLSLKCIIVPLLISIFEIPPLIAMTMFCCEDIIKLFFFLGKYLKGNWIRHGITVSN